MPFRPTLISLSFLALAQGACAATLPAPDGPFGVGLVRGEFVDTTRRMDVDAADSGPRQLPSLVWYPAEGRAAEGGAPYLSPERAAPTLAALGRTFGFNEGDLQPVAQARVAVREGARPLRRAGGFPVVVFSHGLLLYPEQNSALAARLASHGYIVVSTAHPLDAADQRMADGRVVAADFSTAKDDPRYLPAFGTLVTGEGLKDRREALGIYAASIGATRMGRSVAEWRADTLSVAQAIVSQREPAALRDVLAAADRTRLAFAGMSFGGATSATACRRVPACRAAVNLDGQNFDPKLFDAPVGRPLLLMLSDWTRYSLFKGQTREADFSPNDLAYEPWASTGTDPAVTRVRMTGGRHMAFTDFAALLVSDKREARIGEIGGAEALLAVSDLVLAFLDVQVKGGSADQVEQVLRRHAALQRHVPRRMQGWSER